MFWVCHSSLEHLNLHFTWLWLYIVLSRNLSLLRECKTNILVLNQTKWLLPATLQLPLHTSKAIFGVIKDTPDQQNQLKQDICL